MLEDVAKLELALVALDPVLLPGVQVVEDQFVLAGGIAAQFFATT
jgi:hypothetical protein